MRMGINTGPGRGRRHRPRPSHGLHGGRRHHQPRGAAPRASPSRARSSSSRRTQHLRDGFFVFEDLGDFQVKGKTEPVRAYAVSSEISGRTRLEVSRERGLTPLVGRDRELQRLAGIHRRAVDGQGAIALLMGDPGVGKSRLLYEFLRRLEAEGVLVLETTCASYGRSMAYRPIVDLLRRYLGLSEGIAADEIRSCVAETTPIPGPGGRGTEPSCSPTSSACPPRRNSSTACPAPSSRSGPWACSATCFSARASWRRSSSSSRTCTGSIRPRRNSWRIWRRACPAIASCWC